jgi:TM2 domain-containing membrane protein YozV
LQTIFDYLPQMEPYEAQYVQGLVAGMSEDDMRRFASMYSIRRRDLTTMLLLAAIGFIGVAGIHRFVLGHIGMGVLYLLTGGLCWIGTIVDLINIKAMTNDANVKIAQEVVYMLGRTPPYGAA